MALNDGFNVISCLNAAQIYCRYWKSASSHPKGVVFVSHGLSEHCGRYTEFAERLQREDYFVFAHDHVGHGRSEGSRIYIDKIESYARDVFQHFNKIKDEIPESCPKFIVGHSMGGTIAIKCGLMKPDFFRGIVLISPGIAPSPKDTGTIKVYAGKLLNRIAPNFPVHYIDPTLITSRPEKVKEFVDDELCYHGWVKVVWAVAMLEMTEEIKQKVTDITWPFFITQGTKDGITLPQFAENFYEQASSKDKKIKMYENAFHNLLHEVEEVKTSTENEIVAWINDRI